MRQPLVAGEEPTPLQRTLVAADVGNGISAVLDWRRFVFINVDLTVHLERMPEGEWVCVDAVTLPQRERDRHRRVGALRRARPDRPRRPDAAHRRTLDRLAGARRPGQRPLRRGGAAIADRDRRRRETRAIAAEKQEGALVVGQRGGDAGQRRAEADAGVEEGGEGAERRAAPASRGRGSTTISESEG